MRIALVGNGPVSFADGSTVDGFDIVVRLNTAKTYKIAGTRTDFLYMPNVELIVHDRYLDWRAFDAATVIYSHTASRRVEGRRITPIPISKDELSAAITLLGWDDNTKNPSTGLMAIALLMLTYPHAKIHLFGFTHKVAPHFHNGDKEREITDRLVSLGHVIRHSQADTFLYKFLQMYKTQRARLERHALTWKRRRNNSEKI